MRRSTWLVIIWDAQCRESISLACFRGNYTILFGNYGFGDFVSLKGRPDPAINPPLMNVRWLESHICLPTVRFKIFVTLLLL